MKNALPALGTMAVFTAALMVITVPAAAAAVILEALAVAVAAIWMRVVLS